jgi:AAA domain
MSNSTGKWSPSSARTCFPNRENPDYHACRRGTGRCTGRPTAAGRSRRKYCALRARPPSTVGRAKRVTEATGLELKTIHRLSEVDPKSRGFTRNADNPLDCDLLVVDEASMVDVVLMQALMKATPDEAALLTIGDIDQLRRTRSGIGRPHRLGPNSSGASLTEVFRQAAASWPNGNPQPWPKVRLQTCLGSAPRKARATIAPGGIPAMLYVNEPRFNEATGSTPVCLRPAVTGCGYLDVGGRGRRLCANCGHWATLPGASNRSRACPSSMGSGAESFGSLKI